MLHNPVSTGPNQRKSRAKWCLHLILCVFKQRKKVKLEKSTVRQVTKKYLEYEKLWEYFRNLYLLQLTDTV